ncbi:MAG: M20 family metallopeptidase [Deltaproteobacteria bacterium]|nr:M20 family metallopeptidase [Myxococcales bacterium]MDP3217409.1 M20 family metallopeptidase [Deltaproteobacteria bacterium]
MTLPATLAETLDRTLDAEAPALRELALKIHAHPELRFEEHRAAGWISDLLTARGHAVERPLGGLPTALRARAGRAGPRLAILAEYDALPEIGHACGHNLIAAGAVGAFLALAPVAEAQGFTVDLVGTPAEEGGGGKALLLDAGVFAGVDAAMMFHPFDRDLVAHGTLANLWLAMTFSGQPAHAAAAPWDGSSALTACIQTFNLVDSQRVHFRDGVRVHGFITDGGQAVNIIPERASCEFSVRAKSLDELARVRAIVERCALGAAMAAGVEVTIAPRKGYRDLVTNLPLARAFAQHMAAMGRPAAETDERVGMGSTDMGDVSHAVPAIHPWLAICDVGETLCHQHAFARAACAERGLETMLTAARAMAKTGGEFLVDEALRGAVREAFTGR